MFTTNFICHIENSSIFFEHDILGLFGKSSKLNVYGNERLQNKKIWSINHKMNSTDSSGTNYLKFHENSSVQQCNEGGPVDCTHFRAHFNSTQQIEEKSKIAITTLCYLYLGSTSIAVLHSNMFLLPSFSWFQDRCNIPIPSRTTNVENSCY